MPKSQFYPTKLGNLFKLPTPKDKGDSIKAVDARYREGGPHIPDVHFKRYTKQVEKDLDKKYEPKYGQTPFVMNDLTPGEKGIMMVTFHIKTEEELESILAKTDPVAFLISRLKAEEKSAMMLQYGLKSDDEPLKERENPTSEPPKKRTAPTILRLPFPSEEKQWEGDYQEIADAMAAKNDDASMAILKATLDKPKFVVPAEFPEGPKLRRRRVKAPAVQASDRKTRGNGRAKPQTSAQGQQAPISSVAAPPSQAPLVAPIPVSSSVPAAIPGINLPGNNSTAAQGQPASESRVKSIARVSKRQKIQEEIPTPSDNDSESSSSEKMASADNSKRKRVYQPLSAPDEDESPAKKVKVATVASSSAPATLPQGGRPIITKLLTGGRHPISPNAMRGQIAAMQGTKRKAPEDEVEQSMGRSAGSKRVKLRIQTDSQTIPSVNSSAPMPPPNYGPQEKVVDDSEGEEAIEANDEVQAPQVAVAAVPVAKPPIQPKGRDTGLNGGHWSAPLTQKRERKKKVLEPEDEEAEAPKSKRTMKQMKPAIASKKSAPAPKKSQGKAPKKGPKSTTAVILQPQVDQAPQVQGTPQPQGQQVPQPVGADESSSDPGDNWD
ncbi:hypothetical protein HYALB_00007267 [Hymenoscyphus albidus]|uniref:Uncharacterized protein n=1 Tax=Hymenoscyphus albidus TaxID=595503 RepID=A0A9N9LD50_9HELO|nr:hypothetical protein HYALB_00007267 [Hymenoscyphus albidus]